MMAAATTNKVDHPSEQYDQDLAADVEGALWSYDPLRTSNAQIGVSAEEGRVRLWGVVRSGAMKAMAAHLASGVPGVTDVTNALTADTEIEGRLSTALALDSATHLLTDRLTVKSFLGTAYLGGTVAAPTMAEAEAALGRATEIARDTHGVRDVINQAVAVEEAPVDADGGAVGPQAADADAAMPAAMAERMQVWRERASGR